MCPRPPRQQAHGPLPCHHCLEHTGRWSPIITQPATRATLALPIQNTLGSVRFALVAPGYKLKVRGLNVMKMKMLRRILTFKLMEI